MLFTSLEESWKERLKKEFEKSYFEALHEFVVKEYATQIVYPPKETIFNAFERCSFSDTKVVLLGQDPYHNKGQAHGLSFSVKEGVKAPPSLKNIEKELTSDLGPSLLPMGNLTPWAKQGVLLLNSTLTVRANAPGSHQKAGWEQFTDEVIRIVAEEKEQVVFILWGAYAQKKAVFIDQRKHCVIHSAHPSPFSAYQGFFGSKPFSKANAYLERTGQSPINWLGTPMLTLGF